MVLERERAVGLHVRAENLAQCFFNAFWLSWSRGLTRYHLKTSPRVNLVGNNFVLLPSVYGGLPIHVKIFT